MPESLKTVSDDVSLKILSNSEKSPDHNEGRWGLD